ncbi:MAG: hypothetical protein P4L51_17095 [Puia sp.]|nr:hypothetical protein [Puia sp.]
MNSKASFLFGLCLLAIGYRSNAQDTTKRRTIEITSSFKPVLREAVKINFTAVPPVADTARPRLTYNIPAQYLFLTYQPGELKPVALRADSLSPWVNYDYIKIGAGNTALPYFKTALSFGDGKNTFFNIFGDLLNSKGSQEFQKNSLTRVKLEGTVKTEKDLEWKGYLGFKNDQYYLYGFRPDTLKYSQNQLSQAFQTFEGGLSLRNLDPTEFGLTYHPNMHVSVFDDNHNPKASETNAVLNLPLEKAFGRSFAFNLGFTADITNYALNTLPKSQQNNLYSVTPAFLIKTPNLYLQASVMPSWDNGAFTLQPNFLADIKTNDQRFGVQLGWIGYYDKGSYQRFESINPWLAQPGFLLNTRVQERYAGFRGAITDHITYSAKVGFVDYKNMPLFVNDSVDGKSFVIRYESSMQDLQLHGEVIYTQGEVFSLKAALSFNQYTNLKTEEKAWGMLPLEFTTTMKWQVIKDFWVKADLWAWDGAEYRGRTGGAYKGNSAADLNGGVEFRIFRQLNLWFQMNNIFNNKYERWHQYPVYGFNFLGGIVFSFGQK